MNAQERWLLAILVVLADAVAIVVPLTALAAAYVIVVRPPWFREWVAKLYADSPDDGGE